MDLINIIKKYEALILEYDLEVRKYTSEEILTIMEKIGRKNKKNIDKAIKDISFFSMIQEIDLKEFETLTKELK